MKSSGFNIEDTHLRNTECPPVRIYPPRTAQLFPIAYIFSWYGLCIYIANMKV